MSPDRDWYSLDGASQASIQALHSECPVALPDEYIEFLRFSNGGEGPLAVSPYNFCLDSAETALNNWKQGTFKEFFADFFVFGGNGGGELIAFDLRGESPWPIVAIDATNIDLKESVQAIANDFTTFLEYVGMETPDR